MNGDRFYEEFKECLRWLAIKWGDKEDVEISIEVTKDGETFFRMASTKHKFIGLIPLPREKD